MTSVIPRSSGRDGRRGTRRTLSLLSLLSAVLALSAVLLPSPRTSPRGGTLSGPYLELGPGPDLSLFARATKARPFVLPQDHGPHFEYQTEWWYYTGNVEAKDGRRFGFQLTFFRRGLSPGPPPEGAGLASNQVYFAHLAITDVAAERHVAAERFSRGAGGLAGATGAPFAAWLEDWRVQALNADGSAVRLAARDAGSGLALDLELRATKPLVTHGDHGLSPKSKELGNASYYVGYTRMSARGRLGATGIAGGASPSREVDVDGAAWFDHEWSTSALGPGIVGWDWFSLQLDDDREVMFFQLRREDGSVEPVSSGTLVEPDGRTRHLAADDVRVDVLRRWTSPDTRASYPSRWRVLVPTEGIELVIEPWLESQEMRTSFLYWEGAVRASGAAPGAASGAAPGATGPDAGGRPGRSRALTGQGYVELTGYAGSMQGVF